MPYSGAATGLASLGRNGDDTLVHMGRDELQGLQSLAMAHGGHLSINPYTGMPEAFSLKKVLKAVLPIAAAFIPGIGPLAQAGISGLVSGATSGSWKQGLLSALSTWGAGKILGGAETLGAGASDVATKGANAVTAANGAQLGTDAALNSVADIASRATGIMPAATQGATQGAAQTAARAAGAARTGFGLTPNESAGFSKFFNTGKALPGVSKYTLAAAAANPAYVAMQQKKSAFEPLAEEKPQYYMTKYRPGTPNPNSGAGQTPLLGQGYYNPNTGELGGEYVDEYPGYEFMAAEGGEVPSGQDLKSYYKSLMAPPKTASSDSTALMDYVNKINESLKPKPVEPRTTPTTPPPSTTPTTPGLPPGFDFSKLPGTNFMGINLGGVNKVPSYKYDPITRRYIEGDGYAAGGRLLSGGGDGMSDSIPAVIDGPKPQPARLAAGEFVVPSDVVSHLGNGDSTAGGDRLYAMMDKVRQARTGRTKQAPAINPNKYLA